MSLQKMREIEINEKRDVFISKKACRNKRLTLRCELKKVYPQNNSKSYSLVFINHLKRR